MLDGISGYKSLAAAIIVQAVEDIKQMPRRSKEYSTARGFLQGAWFESLCSYLDIDPANARNSLQARLDEERHVVAGKRRYRKTAT